MIVIKFRGEACRPCPMRHLCTSATKGGRQLTVRPRPLPQALDQARAEQPPAPGRTNAGRSWDGAIRQVVGLIEGDDGHRQAFLRQRLAWFRECRQRVRLLP